MIIIEMQQLRTPTIRTTELIQVYKCDIMLTRAYTYRVRVYIFASLIHSTTLLQFT